MHSHGQEHKSGRSSEPGSSRLSQKPPGLNTHWLQHLQRVASGSGESGSADRTKDETEDHAQIQRAAVDQALKSASHPLDPSLRQEMEARVDGTDFSAVRVHDGPEARTAAALVNAKAFTTGQHIVDGGNMTARDWRHEVGHLVDREVPQGTDNGAGLSISDPKDSREQFADAFADWAMSAPTTVQRMADSGGPHQHGSGCGHGQGLIQTVPIQRAPASGASAPAAASVSIAEGEVDEVGPNGTIIYPSVTSCLTITVHLRDGGKVGAHASLFQVPGKRASDQVLPALKAAVGSRSVESVDVSGSIGTWNPKYLEKAIERYTDGMPPEPTFDAKGIGDVVARVLGRQRKKVTVRDVPDGDVIR
ncbi:DUF4157 domain-containing protein [Streptomyces sp. NPDC018045]|uniref:DUF4157 domain-containing protein n=1 Tax=Streptomyces sp. NPDC018045 TaxID=3365037 RepID=UPI00378C8E6D